MTEQENPREKLIARARDVAKYQTYGDVDNLLRLLADELEAAGVTFDAPEPSERASIAELLKRRAEKEAPNAAEALRFMAGVIRDDQKLPSRMLGPVPVGADRESDLYHAIEKVIVDERGIATLGLSERVTEAVVAVLSSLAGNTEETSE